jgi:hypothetical protein
MTQSDGPEPPERVVFSLDEALDLLAVLEDARDALIPPRLFASVVVIEEAIRLVSRKLHLGNEGDSDGD